MKITRLLLALTLVSCGRLEAGATERVPKKASSASRRLDTVRVVSRPLEGTRHLEGELGAYENVAIFARAGGYVSKVLVDRGSIVKSGQLLITLVAPELAAQRAEAQAKLLGDKSTLDRLHAAAETPGAVAAHEIEVDQATVSADEARVQSLRQMEKYLTITAPFDGVVTERNVHPGALVGPPSGATGSPMLRIEQVSQLRLTVPVPENLVGAISEGTTAAFTVSAWPGQAFSGITRRVSHAVDPQTRAMPVELDVDNASGRLAPGMLADVKWPVKRGSPSLFVPPSSIVQSTEKTFVVRVDGGTVDRVPVQRGAAQGQLVEVFGALQEGDSVALRGSEELRPGMHVEPHEVPVPAASD